MAGTCCPLRVVLPILPGDFLIIPLDSAHHRGWDGRLKLKQNLEEVMFLKKLNAASKEQGALTKMCSLCIVTQCDSRAK